MNEPSTPPEVKVMKARNLFMAHITEVVGLLVIGVLCGMGRLSEPGFVGLFLGAIFGPGIAKVRGKPVVGTAVMLLAATVPAVAKAMGLAAVLLLTTGCAGTQVDSAVDHAIIGASQTVEASLIACHAARKGAIDICEGVEGSDRECYVAAVAVIDAACLTVVDTGAVLATAHDAYRPAKAAAEAGADNELGKLGILALEAAGDVAKAWAQLKPIVERFTGGGK